MSTSAVTAQSEPFDLPPFHAEVRAQAEELAARFAERHREVRLHPFEHGELQPELGARSALTAGPDCCSEPSTGAARAGCSPTRS
jgi:hypothetical protein